MRPALQQKKGQRVFFQPLPPTALPSFLTSHLSLQEFVDVSNQMYIVGMSYEENTNLIYRFSLSFPHTKNPNNGLFYKGPLFGLQFSSRGAVSFVKKIFIMKRSFK